MKCSVGIAPAPIRENRLLGPLFDYLAGSLVKAPWHGVVGNVHHAACLQMARILSIIHISFQVLIGCFKV